MREVCQGCGAAFDATEGGGATHAYLGASPRCWAVFGEVLAREYTTPELMGDTHRISVDAYAAQHPGCPEPRTAQSINVHLAGLFLTIEEHRSGSYARTIIAALTKFPAQLPWLAPPAALGNTADAVTVQSVIAATGADDHARIVRLWGTYVWGIWHKHHDHVRATVAAVR